MQPHELFAHWDDVIRPGLLETVGKFHDHELAHAPYAGAWSVGQIIAHIGGAEDFWLRYVVAREVDALTAEPALTTIAEAMAYLEVVHARTRTYLAAWTMDDLARTVDAPWGSQFSLGWVVWHVIEHEVHHRGELSLILGMLGREGLDV